MIKQLILQDWKSFRNATLYFDPLTVVIGTNASGKSNLVDALSFLQKLADGQPLDKIWSEIRGGLEWAIRKGKGESSGFTLKTLISSQNSEYDYLYIVEHSAGLYDISEESIVLIKSKSNFNVDSDTSKLQPRYLGMRQASQNNKSGIVVPEAELYTFIKKHHIREPFSQHSELLTPFYKLPFYGFDENYKIMLDAVDGILKNQSFLILNPLPTQMRSYSPLSKELKNDASNIAGFLAALPEDKKQEIDGTILKYFKHLPEKDIQKIWAEPIGRLGSDAMLYCEELWNPNEPPTLIDARGMSDGTLRFLAILTAMLTRPEGSQIVIEEVDNGLHPSRAGLLLKMLREIGEERKIDVLVTTHNPALLDQLDPDFIPFVMVVHRDAETGNSVITPLDEIENLPKLMASGTLGKITTQGLIEDSLDRKK